VLLDALCQGLGLGVLPCFVGEQQPELQRLEILPGSGVHLHLLYHRDMRKSAAVRAMLDAVSDVFDTHYKQLHRIEH
ncbi:MAG: LysR substrate-binding domain-containing protein, partial [Pseudomonadales bacterium]